MAQTSGTTSGDTQVVNHPVELTMLVMDIWDEWYDAELDRYIIIFRDQHNQVVNLHLTERQIMRFQAFVQSEKAHQKYFKLREN
jgi:hypothetical protein